MSLNNTLAFGLHNTQGEHNASKRKGQMAKTKPRKGKKSLPRLQLTAKIQRTINNLFQQVSQTNPGQITEIGLTITVILLVTALVLTKP